MNNADHGELDAVCGNCNNSFPAEEGGSIFGICLKDLEFDPYIERLFANDFACCANLIERKRFMRINMSSGSRRLQPFNPGMTP